MSKEHDLKTWRPPFRALWDGTKTFELRKNDRNYRTPTGAEGQAMSDRERLRDINRQLNGTYLDAWIISAGRFFSMSRGERRRELAWRRDRIATAHSRRVTWHFAHGSTTVR